MKWTRHSRPRWTAKQCRLVKQDKQCSLGNARYDGQPRRTCETYNNLNVQAKENATEIAVASCRESFSSHLYQNTLPGCNNGSSSELKNQGMLPSIFGGSSPIWRILRVTLPTPFMAGFFLFCCLCSRTCGKWVSQHIQSRRHNRTGYGIN